MEGEAKRTKAAQAGEAPEGMESLYRQLERFSTITAEAITIGDSLELFQQFAAAITEISDFSRVMISIFRPTPPYRNVIAFSGVEETQIHHLMQVEMPPERLWKIVRQSVPLSRRSFYLPGSCRSEISTAEVADGSLGSDANGCWHPSDNVIILLQSGDDLQGFFTVDDCKSGRLPTARSIRPLELFANQISHLLARNKLSEELKRKHRDLELLNKISFLVNSSLDTDEILQKLVDAVGELMNYYHVSVFLDEDGELRIRAFSGAAPTKKGCTVRYGEGVIGRVARTGRTMSLGDTVGAADYIPIVNGTRSKIVVPIRAGAFADSRYSDEVVGVINAESDRVDYFGEEDHRRLESIANSVSMAIEHSRLMDRVLSLLREEAQYSQELEQRKAELDEFVHTISHDLKSPLGSIKGYSEMLEAELGRDEDERVGRFLERIKANVEVVSRMISDLLELSRVGRVEEESHAFSLIRMIDEIRFDLQAASDDPPLKLECRNLPESVRGDRRRLSQLFTNLISNAYKYRSPARPPEVLISCRSAGKFHHFQVRDNGIGIDDKHFNTIFVFGVRLRETSTEGTGAGLAIAKKIVETNSGRMWVESKKGVGSSFHFTWPK